MYKLKMANIVIHVKQWSRKSARIESPDQESVSIYLRLEVELPTSNSNKRFSRRYAVYLRSLTRNLELCWLFDHIVYQKEFQAYLSQEITQHKPGRCRKKNATSIDTGHN